MQNETLDCLPPDIANDIKTFVMATKSENLYFDRYFYVQFSATDFRGLQHHLRCSAEPIHSCWARPSRRGREGLETAAAGCDVTMAAMDFSSLLSTALLNLFRFAAVISLEKIKPNTKYFIYFFCIFHRKNNLQHHLISIPLPNKGLFQ